MLTPENQLSTPAAYYTSSPAQRVSRCARGVLAWVKPDRPETQPIYYPLMIRDCAPKYESVGVVSVTTRIW